MTTNDKKWLIRNNGKECSVDDDNDRDDKHNHVLVHVLMSKHFYLSE